MVDDDVLDAMEGMSVDQRINLGLLQGAVNDAVGRLLAGKGPDRQTLMVELERSFAALQRCVLSVVELNQMPRVH